MTINLGRTRRHANREGAVERTKAALAKRGKRKPGEVRPIAGYDRIGYECLRCSVVFMSADGPQPFCPTCSKALAAADDGGEERHGEG